MCEFGKFCRTYCWRGKPTYLMTRIDLEDAFCELASLTISDEPKPKIWTDYSQIVKNCQDNSRQLKLKRIIADFKNLAEDLECWETECLSQS